MFWGVLAVKIAWLEVMQVTDGAALATYFHPINVAPLNCKLNRKLPNYLS